MINFRNGDIVINLIKKDGRVYRDILFSVSSFQNFTIIVRDMQTPFDLGDKMELVLFEKKEHFFITGIAEFRDGAGFPFKTIEIGKPEKPKQPQALPKKENPALTMNMKKPVLFGAPNKPIPGGSKQISGSGSKQISDSGARRIENGRPKQLPPKR
ncbi:MAG: hypothetical protein LBU81_00235 [Methanosarcinales archaeon]|jgi:hypothetical protein|nr:hypothetical protein [Methanosarcinales archaeon]